MSGSAEESPNGTLPEPPAHIVVLNRDLFFGVKIGNQLKALGYRVSFVKETEGFIGRLRETPAPVLGLIDMNAGVDWNAVSGLTGEGGANVPILAFGSHLDVEGRRAAKAAGVTRVLSNGDFHRDMVALVERYRSPSPSSGIS